MRLGESGWGARPEQNGSISPQAGVLHDWTARARQSALPGGSEGMSDATEPKWREIHHSCGHYLAAFLVPLRNTSTSSLHPPLCSSRCWLRAASREGRSSGNCRHYHCWAWGDGGGVKGGGRGWKPTGHCSLAPTAAEQQKSQAAGVQASGSQTQQETPTRCMVAAGSENKIPFHFSKPCVGKA
ncbi:hypothetical protein BaRGS_00014598 [Batillaria attramentaria]|uniref:Uncharacterized protein n=1 Tax=Batillaria attramentaria TaxID=370345 RepID=A0ABD0L4Q2_9CAEN